MAALVLAGCGGDDDATTTSTGTSGTTQRAEDGDQRDRKPEQGAGEKGGKPTSAEPSESRGSAPTDSAPLPNEGTKAVAPQVPTSRGGDNSIQTFGVEAVSEDRIQAARVAKAYLDARAAKRWAEACAYLAGPTRTQLAQFGKQTGSKDAPDCASVMRAFSAGAPEAALRAAADIRVLSMRMEGQRAFLLYRDGEGIPSAMPMAREGGEWKVGALVGSALLL